VHAAAGPRENGMRPSVDTLFRSAARAYGARVVGVVLTGTLSDGAIGLTTIKLRGGTAFVQDPREALFAGMPTSALTATEVDFCGSVREIAARINKLAREPMDAQDPRMNRHDSAAGGDVPEDRSDPLEPSPVGEKAPNLASGLTCPECQGSIWELQDGTSVRFECRVGHVYGPEAFAAEQGERVEAALWTAINTLHERSETFLRLAALYRESAQLGPRYLERAKQTSEHAETLRSLLYTLVQDGEVG
jgi:two-component system chemotaxis response regulator CheB